MSNQLESVRLRCYHVGFGDCFLLSFFYGDQEITRHVLIDFGTTQTPQNKKDVLHRIAEDIRKEVSSPNSELTAVVATHRHKDHIDGFRTKEKLEDAQDDPEQPGDVIRACAPKLVIQPWTEDPDIDTDATAPPDPKLNRKAFRSALADLGDLSAAIARESRLHSANGVADQLQFLGENNLPNRSAVENLIAMGKAQNSKAEYVYAGYQTALSTTLLPGVTVTVLGPPTLEQSSKIARQRTKDEEDFWHVWQQTVKAVKRGFTFEGNIPETNLERVFPCSYYAPGGNPPQARWFRRRMQEMRGLELLELVRTLDKVLNNTSVILLFEFGGKTLLFPGDAQIENWSYSLENEGICKKLKSVDLYKVGHHGSLNATPKSLWDLLMQRHSEDGVTPVMKTVVSTLAGKHGHPEDGTEVPRIKLVSELKEKSEYYSTQVMEPTEDYHHDIKIL